MIKLKDLNKDNVKAELNRLQDEIMWTDRKFKKRQTLIKRVNKITDLIMDNNW